MLDADVILKAEPEPGANLEVVLLLPVLNGVRVLIYPGAVLF